jgi:4-nitrophenyl phosphatase
MGKIALLLDLDGVLVKNKNLDLFGDTLKFLNFLRERHIPFRVVSNNSRIPPKVLRERLTQKEINLKESELLTALMVAPSYLKRFKSVYAFAEDEVKEYLKEEGINLVDDYRVEAVFIAQNHKVDFDSVKKVTSAVKLNNAKIVAVNLNKLAKDNDGLVYPATGSWVEMFAFATDYPKGEIISLGKPSEEFFKLALKGFENYEVYFVSDDFYTDLIPAEKYGIKTIFMTTGKYTKQDLEKAGYKPFKVFNSLTELKKFLENII